MEKKTIIIGLTAGALMVTSLGIASIKNTNVGAFAQKAASNEYVAVIDKDNRIKNSASEGWFGFQLHGSEEYGLLYVSQPDWIDINPADDYSDYAFSWTNKDGTDKYFEISLYDLGETSYYKERIDGKDRYVRGFPGAYRLEVVFYNPNNISFDETKPNQKWTCVRSTDETTHLTTDIATLTDEVQPSDPHMAWCSREAGVIYIKSIKIFYTCG